MSTSTDQTPAPILEVRNLRTTIPTQRGDVRGVDGVSFTIAPGEALGMVGESGSGKSITAFSLLRLLPARARMTADVMRFKGTDLLDLPEAGMRALRGNRISMIFQDPMTSLNPVFSVGGQISEVLRRHRGLSRAAAKAEAIRLMELVELPQARRRYGAYPYQFSGGQRQRLVIAMALSCNPDLVLADEPTTALDVTVEKQVLALLHRTRKEFGSALLLITHNLALIEEHCDRIAVLYAGEIIEMTTTAALFDNPLHPYTRALLASVPRHPIAEQRIAPLQGLPPVITGDRGGCSFAPRCPARMPCCDAMPPLVPVADGHDVRCFLHARQ